MTIPGKERSVAQRPPALELRREERLDVALAVEFEAGGRGMTRNVSASGIYVETIHPVTLGAPLRLIIEFDSKHGPLRMRCDANILRLDQLDGRRGIAAAISWTQ